MDNPEKLDKCDSFKQKGNMFIQKEENPIAAKFYEMIIEYVEHEYCMEGEEEQRRAQVFLNGNLNLPKTYLKMEKYIEAIECCDKAIKTQIRPIPRAHLICMDHENALTDFQKTVELEPENNAALWKMDECHWTDKECKRYQRENDRMMMSELGQNQDSGFRGYERGMNDIGNWDNMAADMMTLEEESAAFGEILPEAGGITDIHR